MRRAAVIVSALLHPLYMPLIGIFIAINFDWYIAGRVIPEQAKVVYLLVALSTIAFPGINMLLLRWYGVVKSLEMPTRKERTTPYLSTLFFFILGYYLLRKGQLPDAIYSILLGCSFSLIFLFVVNTFWKISAHATGISGVLGIAIALSQIHQFNNITLLVVLICFVGLVCTARLILGAHTPAQVYTGAIGGFTIAYLSVFLEIFI